MRTSVYRDPTTLNRELMLLFGGPAFFQALVSADRLGLFKSLAAQPGLKLDALSQALGLPDLSVRALVMTTQSLGLVIRDSDGGLRNQPWVTASFAGDTQELSAVLEAYEQLLYRPFGRMEASLKGGTNAGLELIPGPGKTLYERLTAHPALERVFHAWMSNLSSQGLPPRLVASLAGCQHVLDVGGGDGTNAVLLARAHPDLHVTVLDLPSVCAQAEERAERESLSGRVRAVSWNIREGDFPSGSDAILFSRIFNIYTAEQNADFVSRAARALPEGGRLVVYPAMVANDDGGGPLSAAYLALYYLCVATGEGRVYAPSEYEQWFRDAGFSALDCTVDERDEAVFVGVK
jgi:ubiquinone/menaquinone biosynthesis C-methylase UbiE